MTLSEDVVETSWRTIGAMDEMSIRRLQKALGKAQEELMAFLIAWNSNQRREVVELALYLGLVIMNAFRSGPAVRIKRVTENDILRLLRRNEELMADLPDSLEDGLKTLLSPESVSEPAIMAYILSALAEVSEDPEESAELTDFEFWHLVLTLRTFSDALHDASCFEGGTEVR